MPRAPSERPSRRLDAILETIRRHGVIEFEALELEGIGKGLKFVFGPPPARNGVAPRARGERPDPDLAPPPSHDDIIDELDLVAEGREGPVPGNGVS